MKLEDFEEVNDAIYCAINSIKLLRICIMRLSELKKPTLHGLRWNNSPVSLAVLFCFVFFFFAEVCYLICVQAYDRD